MYNVLILVFSYIVAINKRVQSATENKLTIAGYPPRANVKRIDDKMVYFKENVFSFSDNISAEITIRFQLRQGITINAKYINDKRYGVIAVNKQNVM